MKSPKLIVIVFSFLFINQLNATVFHAQANGDWDLDATWLESGVPGIGDDVIIDGFKVDIDNGTGNVIVQSITIVNSSLAFSYNSILYIDGAVVVTVTGDLIVTADDVNRDVELKIQKGGVLSVDGDAIFTRTASNSFNKKLKLTIRENLSTMVVDGKFIFDYQNAGSGEDDIEIFMEHQSTLTVMDSTIFKLKAGADFTVYMKGDAFGDFRGPLHVEGSGGEQIIMLSDGNAYIQVGESTTILDKGTTLGTKLLGTSHATYSFNDSLVLKSEKIDSKAMIELESADNIVNVSGDVVLFSLSEGDVHIDMQNGNLFYITGAFYRPNKYGSLLMDDKATVIYNGTSPQTLAAPTKPGAGSDAFNYANIGIENTAGISLEDTLLIKDELTLSSGKITVLPSTPIILGDYATISGGSATSYIDGPLTKVGRSEFDFEFPVGKGAVYAPIKVTQLTSSTAEYTVEYRGDPPPFGENGAKIETVYTTDYWSLRRSVGSPDVGISLNWESTQDQGYPDLGRLIVVGLDENDIWQTYGNGGTTGAVGVDGPGSVMSLGDPPPFGINNFAIATATIELPVELVRFHAVQEDAEVNLSWQTASEINTSKYVIERSTDGYVYEAIGSVPCRGESSSLQSYAAKDEQPFYGQNFYRLKVEDFDGSFEYSPIELLTFKVVPVVTIYPNPVRELINLSIGDAENASGILEIFDQSGRRIFTNKVRFDSGLFTGTAAELNISQPGIYTLRILINSDDQVIKFIKLKN